MTTPNTPNRFVAGAIDLGEVKARAEARAQAQSTAASGTIAPVVTLSMANVEEELVKRSAQVPVVVLIGSERSPESQQLRADFTELAQAANLSFIFAYADADQTPDIAHMFGVQGLPTVAAIAAGQPIANFSGGQPKEALQQWVAAVVQAVAGQLTGISSADEPATDPRFQPAEDALNAGDFAAAIAVYDSILTQEPKNAEALAARDNARLLARLQEAEGDDPIAAAAAQPTGVPAAFAAADAEIAAGAAEAAFDRLLRLMDTVPAQKAEIQERLLELFALFDATNPWVLAARGKLANALF